MHLPPGPAPAIPPPTPARVVVLRDVGLFAVAFAISASLPGPDTMLLFSRALGAGARAAVPIALGLTLGKLGLLSAALAGVTAAATTLGPVFVVLKVAGGLYLLWLSVKLWNRAGRAPEPQEEAAARSRLGKIRGGWRGVGLGALLTLSNPQALLFYLAVLPAVLGAGPVGLQEYLLLCLTLSMVMAVVASTYIALATRTRSVLSSTRRKAADRAGAVLLGLTGAVVASR